MAIFEHAWLANVHELLGWSRAIDLSVREARYQYDSGAVLTRSTCICPEINNPWCDRMELRPDSHLVSGLCSAVMARCALPTRLAAGEFLNIPGAGRLPAWPVPAIARQKPFLLRCRETLLDVANGEAYAGQQSWRRMDIGDITQRAKRSEPGR